MVQLVPVPSKAKALSKGRPKRHPHRLVKATWKLRESHESAESCDACDLKCSYWMWHTRFGARKRRKRGNIELPVLCFAGFELSLGSAYFKWWPDKFKTKNSTGTWHWLMKQSKSVLLPQHSVSSVSSVCGFLVMFSPLFIRLHPVIPKLKPRKSALTRHSLAAFWTFEISSSSQPENFGRKNEQNRNVMKQLDTHTIASFTSHMTLDVVLQNVLMGFHGLCKSTAEQNRHVREEKFRLGRWQSWSSTSSSDTSKRIRNLQSQVPFSVSCHFLSFLFMSNVCRLRERLGAAFNDLLNISHDLALDVGGREALDFDLQCSVFAFRKKNKRSNRLSENPEMWKKTLVTRIHLIFIQSSNPFESVRCEKMFSELIPGLWWLRLRLHNSSLAAFCLASPQDQKGRCAVKSQDLSKPKSIDIQMATSFEVWWITRIMEKNICWQNYNYTIV